MSTDAQAHAATADMRTGENERESPKNRFSLKSALLVLGALALVRILFINLRLNLFFDEAYYWLWSRSPALGYYSKPPMVAWLIAATTTVFGNSEFGIRIASPLLYFLAAVFIYLSARKLFDDERIAFCSSLAFSTFPGIFLLSVVISTDCPLLFFWSLSLYVFIVARNSEARAPWIALGLLLGLGLLSKYTMLVLPASLATYVFFLRNDPSPRQRSNCLLALLTAFLVFSPNLYWNYHHGFISFIHTKKLATPKGFPFHPLKFLEFFTGQFVVVGPLSFYFILRTLGKISLSWKEDNGRLLIIAALPLLLFMLVFSLFSRANANWAAPSYIGGSILFTWILLREGGHRALQWAIGVNLALGCILYSIPPLTGALGIDLPRKLDLYQRLRGWDELGRKVSPYLNKYKNAVLMGESRKTISQVAYYARPRVSRYVSWNPGGLLRHQMDLCTDINDYRGADFIFVSTKQRKSVLSSFRVVEKLDDIRIHICSDYSKIYHVYHLRDVLKRKNEKRKGARRIDTRN